MQIRSFQLLKFSFALVALAGSWPLSIAANEPNDNWPRFRGPDGNGVAQQATPPIEWGADSDNLKWKTEIPGKGSSSPIVWENKVFVTTAVDTGKLADGSTPQADSSDESSAQGDSRGERGRRGRRGRRSAPPQTVHEFSVYCLGRDSGQINWQTTLNAAVPHEGHHGTNTYASGSPVTNGEHLFVSFGSFGIYCLDMQGNVVWDRDLGDMSTRNSFGEGVSPALYRDKLVVNWDHEGQSFITVLNAANGETIWKKDRDEKTGWATPVIVEHEGRVQVIVNATQVVSYDLSDGSVIWECGGQTGNPIPTPLVAEQHVICMTGFRSSACYAIPLDSRGDVSDSDSILWKSNAVGPYVATGVLYDGTVYATKGSRPVLYVLDAHTGDEVYEAQRLPDIRSLYASMVAAHGHVYITGRSGKTLVLRHGDQFQIVASNELGEPVDATPAVVDNQIIIRGARSVFCFER